MTTRDIQIQYLTPIEGTWFLMDAQIAVLGFKLVKDDRRHHRHDIRERARAKARREAMYVCVPEVEVRHV
ncbi:hypothetical protein G6L30_08010 [Agrobacterium rhizogenes]|nr:hypothetical protein [Rhizobium rhizogenes]